MASMSNRHNAVILFDGVCNLCQAAVQFVIARDPQAYFTFASLQSPAGQQLLAAHGLTHEVCDSVVLIEGTHHWTESDAALRIVPHLTGWWPLLAWLTFLPRPLRNGVYRYVARQRYRWFGRHDTCLLPTPELRQRFLD